MGTKFKHRKTVAEDAAMENLYALIANTNKRMPVAKDEGTDSNKTYEQNARDVQEHWRKVNLRNSGKSVSINLPAGEVGNGVGQGAGKDATDLTLEEQFEKHEKAVGKDSLVERNAIAARRNVVTVHKLESSSVVSHHVTEAQANYDRMVADINS